MKTEDKKYNFRFLPISEWFGPLIFVIWFTLSVCIFYSFSAPLLRRLPKLLHPEERARAQINYKLYNFIEFCKKIIPERSKVFFYISPETYGTNMMLWHFHRYVVSYFMYPLKVYTAAENSVKDILDNVNYIIISGTNKIDFNSDESDFSRYKLLAVYDEHNFIVIKKW